MSKGKLLECYTSFHSLSEAIEGLGDVMATEHRGKEFIIVCDVCALYRASAYELVEEDEKDENILR